MKLTVLAFGIAKDIVGSRSITVDLDAGTTVQDLCTFLEKQYPGIKELASLGIAVNNEYAGMNDTLSQNDEIAIIPPVSGG